MRILTALMVAAVVGCAGEPTGVKGITVTVTPEPLSFVSGANMTISVAVTNHATFPQSLYLAGCRNNWVVRNAEGTIVAPVPCSDDLPSLKAIVLAPGDTKALQDVWNGNQGTQEPSTLLSPGEYELRGRIEGIESAPVKVVITPP